MIDKGRKTKAFRNQHCLNKPELATLHLQEVPKGKKKTFYCAKYNCTTTKEDCKKCKYYN